MVSDRGRLVITVHKPQAEKPARHFPARVFCALLSASSSPSLARVKGCGGPSRDKRWPLRHKIGPEIKRTKRGWRPVAHSAKHKSLWTGRADECACDDAQSRLGPLTGVRLSTMACEVAGNQSGPVHPIKPAQSHGRRTTCRGGVKSTLGGMMSKAVRGAQAKL